MFPDDSQLLSLITKEEILQAFQNEICNASEQLIWLFPTTDRLLCLAKETLGKLLPLFEDKSWHDLLYQAIVLGRFDKDDFKLKNSLIVGEDGGLYLLLNRLDKEQQKDMIQKNIVTEIYLKDKMVKAEKAEEEEVKGDAKKEYYSLDKIVLGKGGFGKVRLALNLFRGKKDFSGDIVCIKKTKNFVELAPQGGDMIPSALHEATHATLEDYFASGVAEKVYAPQILDLALVTDPLVNKKGNVPSEGLPDDGNVSSEHCYQDFQRP